MMDATRQCKRPGYNPTYTIQMIDRLGHVDACKRILDDPGSLDGFTRLWELRRLDLTLEAIVLRAEFASPFAGEELGVARKRLSDVGYSVP
jgi:hypothetical protein